MKIKKMKNYKTTKQKWELKMKEKEEKAKEIRKALLTQEELQELP